MVLLYWRASRPASRRRTGSGFLDGQTLRAGLAGCDKSTAAPNKAAETR